MVKFRWKEVQEAKRERFLQRGTEACAVRIQRTAIKRAITNDLQDWLEKLVGEANGAAEEGDMGRVFAGTKNPNQDTTDRTKSSVMRRGITCG